MLKIQVPLLSFSSSGVAYPPIAIRTKEEELC